MPPARSNNDRAATIISAAPRNDGIVGVGMPFWGTPSTDPDERDYRIRLLPWVMTPNRNRGQK
jgi:hypothetical protein